MGFLDESIVPVEEQGRREPVFDGGTELGARPSEGVVRVRLVADVVPQKAAVRIANRNAEEHVAALALNVIAVRVRYCFARVSLRNVDAVDRPDLATP